MGWQWSAWQFSTPTGAARSARPSPAATRSRRMARGGMGAVYRARDVERRAGRAQALARRPNATARGLFEREFHTLRSCKHPRIIEVLRLRRRRARRVLHDGAARGRDMRASSRRCRTARARICATSRPRSRCSTRAGLLHRDVSPQNVRVTEDGALQADRLRRAAELRPRRARRRHAAVHPPETVAARRSISAPICIRSARLRTTC